MIFNTPRGCCVQSAGMRVQGAVLALFGASASSAVGLVTPHVSFSSNSSNLPSSSRAIGKWTVPLGHSTSLQACAELCIAWDGSHTPTPAATTRCRSFTRYADDYSVNASLAGQCTGRIDSAWVPLHVVAVDSGAVLWPCDDAMDCSLNGKCSANKTCACSTGWTGTR
jgi:hypothetical protein